jgi:hypothetical protein
VREPAENKNSQRHVRLHDRPAWPNPRGELSRPLASIAYHSPLPPGKEAAGFMVETVKEIPQSAAIGRRRCGCRSLLFPTCRHIAEWNSVELEWLDRSVVLLLWSRAPMCQRVWPLLFYRPAGVELAPRSIDLQNPKSSEGRHGW